MLGVLCHQTHALALPYAQFEVVCPVHIKTDLLRFPLPRRAMVSFLHFRTGCHGLPNIFGGWDRVPRFQRLCLCVSLNIQMNGTLYQYALR